MNKRITNLSIKGLNTSMPDSIVPDGACDVLTNMRFRDGSWQSMGNIAQVAKIPLPDIGVTSSNFVSFVGIHEVEGKEHYICKCIIGLGGDNYELHLCVYHDSKWEDLGTISTHNTTTELQKMVIRVTSFGNVLIVCVDNKMLYYVWKDNRYSPFTTPRPASVSEEILSFTPRSANYTYEESVSGIVYKYSFWYLIDEARNLLYPANYGNNLEWWGEICYLVAYRMKDGSIVAPSNLHILCSESVDTEGIRTITLTKRKFGEEYIYCAYRHNVIEAASEETNRMRRFLPKLTIEVSDDIDTDFIDRVALYSTRINNLLDFDKLVNDFKSTTGTPIRNLSSIYSDNNLPNQPLYLVAEKNINELTDRKWEIELGYDKLKDLVTSSFMFTPTQVHSIQADVIYGYNNRVHYGSFTTALYSHEPNFSAIIQAGKIEHISQIMERISFDDIPAVAVSSPMVQVNGDVDSTDRIKPLSPIISYPDYRATSLDIGLHYDNGSYGMDTAWHFNLKPALANNYAYYIFPASEDLKYNTAIIKSILQYSPHNQLMSTTTFSEPNRIQVSAPNNPFSLPFENSYAVGNEGSRVVAMNTVADSLVDSNFYGNYPLYIFTTDGIFALRSGSGEVLYAGTEIVNHDKLINPNTIALNGSIVYACTDGLKALTGRQGVRISADIDPIALVGAEFGINWEYGELLCRLSSGKVYVWNVGANVWSQREDIAGHIKDGYIGQPTQKDGILIYDINKENEGEIKIELRTRPLKFDSLGFKKIDSLIARLASPNADIWNIKVESSNDCQQWHTIKWATTQGMTSDIGLRRFGQSARFYRLTIEGNVKGKVAFTQIDMTIQDRYNNKLR